jgi:hypothetical protein
MGESVMSNGTLGLFAEFWAFMVVRKKWWLAPIIVMLLVLGALIFLAQASALSPFIYTIF